MGLWEDVTGVLDGLALNTDEAVARSFDDEEGGGVWDGFASVPDRLALSTDEAFHRSLQAMQEGDVAGVLDANAGSFDEWWARNTVTDTFTDTVWQGHPGDEIDLLGPALWGHEGSVFDWATHEPGEKPPDFTPDWLDWILDHQEEVALFLAVVVFLAVAGPLFDIIANLTEDAA